MEHFDDLKGIKVSATASGFPPAPKDERIDCPGMVEMIEGMTDLTIATLKNARDIHKEGQSESVAYLETLDVVDGHFAVFRDIPRQALESHVRRVVAEFYAARREPWED
jgi:hypothetical protein